MPRSFSTRTRALLILIVLTLAPVAPNISATKSATLTTDVNGNGFVNPGDTLTYSITISNSGSAATTVRFQDTPGANTMFVPGSVSVSPSALDDSYTATGHVSISVPAGSGVLANDYLGLNPTATITAFDATSAQGRTVAVNADGSFTYNPPGTFMGTDSFHYTLSNSTGSSIGLLGSTTLLPCFIGGNAC